MGKTIYLEVEYVAAGGLHGQIKTNLRTGTFEWWLSLVERLWPRGISKQKAALDFGLQEAAPSSELRTWFGHDPAKWEEFRRRYRDELRDNQDAIRRLRELARRANLTLVYAARNMEHNAAVVLR